MSIELLKVLNQNKRGELGEYIKTLDNNPAICWYPSSAFDVSICSLLLTKNENQVNYKTDIFLFTDTIYRTFDLNSLDGQLISLDNNLDDFISLDGINRIEIIDKQYIGVLDTGEDLIIGEHEKSINNNKIFYINLNIHKKQNEEVLNVHLLMIGCQNEWFCHDYLIPYKAKIKYLLNKNATGYGGYMSGIWRVNLIKRFECEYFITTLRDGENRWNEGDDEAIKRFPEFGPVVPCPPIYNRELGLVQIRVGEGENNIMSFKCCRIRQYLLDNYHSNEMSNSKFIGVNKLVK